MKLLTRTMVAAGLLGISTLAVPRHVAAQRSGVDIWSQTCGRCHMIQPANRYTADQWESIIMHMSIIARLTDHEAEAVLEFLKGGAKRRASTKVTAPAAALLASAHAPSFGRMVTYAPDSTDDFLSHCVACHGKSARGDGPAAVALNPRPTDLTDLAFQDSRTDLELEDVVRNGKGTMPGFSKQLNDGQIGAIVAYIRSLARTNETR